MKKTIVAIVVLVFSMFAPASAQLTGEGAGQGTPLPKCTAELMSPDCGCFGIQNNSPFGEPTCEGFELEPGSEDEYIEVPANLVDIVLDQNREGCDEDEMLEIIHNFISAQCLSYEGVYGSCANAGCEINGEIVEGCCYLSCYDPLTSSYSPLIYDEKEQEYNYYDEDEHRNYSGPIFCRVPSVDCHCRCDTTGNDVIDEPPSGPSDDDIVQDDPTGFSGGIVEDRPYNELSAAYCAPPYPPEKITEMVDIPPSIVNNASSAGCAHPEIMDYLKYYADTICLYDNMTNQTCEQTQNIECPETEEGCEVCTAWPGDSWIMTLDIPVIEGSVEMPPGFSGPPAPSYSCPLRYQCNCFCHEFDAFGF